MKSDTPERDQADSLLSAGVQEALGQSEAFLDFQERLSRAAPVNRPILLLGERGTGKELAAARLHYLSPRWQEPLLALNCAALAPGLIESELFGYEKGAFTGADRRRIGRFEAADGGSLFLDEIGNLPVEVQYKILRVVEYGTFERVGGSRPIEVDVRIVAATHADLKSLVSTGKFQQDLLDRLSFEVLHLPPLRDRGEDILLLAEHFAARMAAELKREEMPRFSAEARRALQNYPWPGNVRELKNVVERAVYRSDSAYISRIDFDPLQSPFQPPPMQAAASAPPVEAPTAAMDVFSLMRRPLKEAVRDLELRMLKQALEESRFNQRKAARRLGLTYHQCRGLYRKYRRAIAG